MIFGVKFTVIAAIVYFVRTMTFTFGVRAIGDVGFLQKRLGIFSLFGDIFKPCTQTNNRILRDIRFSHDLQVSTNTRKCTFKCISQSLFCCANFRKNVTLHRARNFHVGQRPHANHRYCGQYSEKRRQLFRN